MASWFGRKREVTPTIESVSFDTAGWKDHGEQQSQRVRLWETHERDPVTLNFFPLKPDFPPLRSLKELSAFYSESLKATGGTVVECEFVQVADCRSIRLLIKVPQERSGMFYQGSITLPFRDFSFVIKSLCKEVGTTGVREAVLMSERMKAGEIPNLGVPGPMFPGWNPDAPEHDQNFPTHPISRLRRLLDHVSRTTTIDPRVRELPAYRLPDDVL